jgi:hypothetical protein
MSEFAELLSELWLVMVGFGFVAGIISMAIVWDQLDKWIERRQARAFGRPRDWL